MCGVYLSEPLGAKERRIREKESLRQDILDAARELLIEEGYESVSLRRIVKKIEYSPTTIYLYFQDKAELLNNLWRRDFREVNCAAGAEPRTFPRSAGANPGTAARVRGVQMAKYPALSRYFHGFAPTGRE